MILGVTGGIATGKSTICSMLEKLGAPLIDLDVVARKIVEPGQPASKKIDDYFGKQVLFKNGKLDRKKLSNIVFNDVEKRKKLESFTHPAIFDKLNQQVKKITVKDPNAIIQVGVPLLFELNLQYMFDKILVVYINRKEQIKRLSKRGGISFEKVENILNSQMPIDEKIGVVDFIINNESSLEDAEKQVKDLWNKLKTIQKNQKR